MRTLHISLKSKYFNAIKNGHKPFEYRLYNEYWAKRLVGEAYDEVWFKLGYPATGDDSRILKRKYLGYELQTIVHEKFGNEPVDVFAISFLIPLREGARTNLCKQCFKEMYSIISICSKCVDNNFCIDGCGNKAEWCKRCSECEKKHNKWMKNIKRFLKV